MIVLSGKKRTVAHLVYGTLFGFLALVSIVVLVLLVSQADTTTQTVTIGNAAPSVDSVSITGTSYGGSPLTSVTLTESTTTSFYVWGVASDVNGCEEIDQGGQYSLKFYRTDKTDSCATDNNDCYSVSSATVDQCTPGGGDTTTRYQFIVPLQYYADPTDSGSPQSATNWTAQVTATDDGSATGNASATTEINGLISLDVTPSIAYGSLSLGATSASDQTVAITNTGNVNMDANVKADGDMTCSVSGAIIVGQVKYSLSSGFTYASAGTAMTTIDANSQNSTAQRTNDATPSTTSLYLKIQIPTNGVAGACSNTLTFTAITDV